MTSHDTSAPDPAVVLVDMRRAGTLPRAPWFHLHPSGQASYTVPVKERIQKVLANAGVASRRNVEEMILQGRVAVNGHVRTKLPILVDPGRDKITVDDEPVKLAAARGDGKDGAGAPRLYILLNKPKGVYSTNVAQGVQTRAIDLLPPNLP